MLCRLLPRAETVWILNNGCFYLDWGLMGVQLTWAAEHRNHGKTLPSVKGKVSWKADLVCFQSRFRLERLYKNDWHSNVFFIMILLQWSENIKTNSNWLIMRDRRSRAVNPQRKALLKTFNDFIYFLSCTSHVGKCWYIRWFAVTETCK